MGRFLSSCESSLSFHTSSNLLSSESGILFFLLFGIGGGGKTGSTAILKSTCQTFRANLLYCVFDHGWDEACDVGRAQLQAGICVDLNQPGLQVFI